MKTMRIDQKTLSILSRGVVVNNIFKISDGQLDRSDYLALDKVLKAIGGKWNRGKQGHVFSTDITSVLDDILITGEYSNTKNLLQFFETPDFLAHAMIQAADLQVGESILEPSAGHGAIAREIRRVTSSNLKLVEIDPTKCAELARQGFTDIICTDFLSTKFDNQFDKVIMNPPFSHQQDVDHVLHAFKAVRAGGRLIAIMSAGFTFRLNSKSTLFRELVDYHGTYTHNPDDTFKSSGTLAKTVMVILNK